MKKYVLEIIRENILEEIQEKDAKAIIPRLLFNNRRIDLNESATFIMDSIDGNMSVNDIIDAMEKRYVGVSRDKLEEDTMTILRKLWKLGIVSWKDNMNPFNENDKLVFNEYRIDYVGLEHVSDFMKVSNHLEFEYCNPYRYKKKIANKLYLEQAIVNNFSYNFLLFKNEEPIACSMIGVDVQNLLITMDYCAIKNMMAIENMDKTSMETVILWMEDKVFTEISAAIPQRAKEFHWMILTTKMDVKINSILDNMNSVSKTLLANETIDGDLMMYIINRNFSKKYNLAV